MGKKENINVAILEGNFHDRRDVLGKIKQMLGKHDLFLCEGNESFEHWKSEIQCLSMFNEKRLYVFTEWPEFSGTKQKLIKNMIDLVDNVPDECIIVFNNVPNMPASFVKHVKKIGKVFSFETHVPKNKSHIFVSKEMKNMGKEIEMEDAKLIAESVGVSENNQYSIDIDRLIVAVNKVTLFVGNKKKVTRDDIVASCSDSSDFIVWSLFNYLDNKDFINSIIMINKAIQYEKDTKSASFKLLNLFSWRYRMLWFLREACAKTSNTNEIVNLGSKLHKLKRSGNGLDTFIESDVGANGSVKQRYSEKLILSNLKGGYGRKAPVSCYGKNELMSIVKCLDETMEKIRYGCCESEMLILFDLLCMKICGVKIDSISKKFRSVEL